MLHPVKEPLCWLPSLSQSCRGAVSYTQTPNTDLLDVWWSGGGVDLILLEEVMPCRSSSLSEKCV